MGDKIKYGRTRSRSNIKNVDRSAEKKKINDLKGVGRIRKTRDPLGGGSGGELRGRIGEMGEDRSEGEYE